MNGGELSDGEVSGVSSETVIGGGRGFRTFFEKVAVALPVAGYSDFWLPWYFLAGCTNGVLPCRMSNR